MRYKVLYIRLRGHGICINLYTTDVYMLDYLHGGDGVVIRAGTTRNSLLQTPEFKKVDNGLYVRFPNNDPDFLKNNPHRNSTWRVCMLMLEECKFFNLDVVSEFAQDEYLYDTIYTYIANKYNANETI